MRSWLEQHRHALGDTLKRFFGTPFSTLLNVGVIGIALSFPAGVYTLLQNLQALSARVASTPQISVFLARDATRDDAARIQSRLQRDPAVLRVRFVPKDQAFQELKQSAGLADVAQALNANPLPDAFVVDARDTTPEALERLGSEIRKWDKVKHVQLDSEWARRLDAFLKLSRVAVLMLAGLLSFALVAVTFNTIRLQILTQRQEIEVAKLIGATNAFIRRPFLYHGALLGLTGGIAAWGIVALGIHFLNSPVAELAELYGSGFRLSSLAPADGASLLAFSAWLGLLGAGLSVNRHLKRIDPK